MNGPWHYDRAVEIAELVDNVGPSNPMDPEQMANLLRSAQVHATLALAAASALPTVVRCMGDDRVVTDWADAIGHQRGADADRTT